jgi:hypothetical protein
VATIITVSDLPQSVQSAELVRLMVDGANANASRVAPCLAWDGSDPAKPAPTDDQEAEARLILIGAVKRWAEAGAGALSQQTAGPFGMTVDTRQRTGFNLWPSEIERLQDICRTTGPVGRTAFSIDTAPTSGGHAPWCSINFGATYCSCGYDIAGFPIYEGA